MYIIAMLKNYFREMFDIFCYILVPYGKFNYRGFHEKGTHSYMCTKG